QVRDEHRDSFPHQPAPVHADPVDTQGQAGTLQIEELVYGQVNRDLLRVGFPPTGLPPWITGGAGADGAEQFGDSRQIHPARTGPARSACRHRSSTSLASSR